MDSDSENEVEEEFQKASNYVQSQATKEGAKKLNDKILLQLYGFYKVGTIGANNDPQPRFYDIRGKAKWNAWKNVSDLTSEEAKLQYIQLVKESYDWNPDLDKKESSEGSSSKKSMTTGNVVSTFAVTPEELDDIKDQDTIFGWAKDNNIPKIKDWLQNGNNPNIQDENKLTPLHWTIDRGLYQASKILLEAGADQKLQDNDGQTAIDYAETCEHKDIINLLKSFSS